jgi:hypothetical protein
MCTVVAEDAKPGQGGKERNKGFIATCRYDRSRNSGNYEQNNCRTDDRIRCPNFAKTQRTVIALDGERTEVGGRD